jgi:hypothetical protein
MSEFNIPKQIRVNFRTLAKGFGLPIVKQALLTKPIEQQSDKPDFNNKFGLPVYGSLFIVRPSYTSFEFNETTGAYSQTVITMPHEDSDGTNLGLLIDSVLIDLTKQKNIVTTEISGRSGTVKEYINEGDLQLTVRGFIASLEPNVFPAERVTRLQQYLNAPVALKLVNNFLNNNFAVDGKNADTFVITSYNFFQQEGVRNIQFFEFNAISDSSNEIIENNATT